MSVRSLSLAFTATGVLAAAASAQLTAWGVTNNERLVSFDTSTPGALLSNVAITGLNANEKVYGVDARPASVTGSLVIVTSENRLMNLGFDGVATPIGSGFTPALSSTQFGFDFNPTVDRVRVMTSDTGNRRLNPVTGASVATDTALTFSDGQGTPFVVGTAYNSFQFGVGAPVGSVRQFVIDARRDVLAETGSQAGGNASFNAGVLTPIGPLGFDLADESGFDIFGPTQTAFISSHIFSNSTSFYSVNLATGAATSLGEIGDGAIVVDFAVIPTPGAAGLLGLGALASLRRRR